VGSHLFEKVLWILSVSRHLLCGQHRALTLPLPSPYLFRRTNVDLRPLCTTTKFHPPAPTRTHLHTLSFAADSRLRRLSTLLPPYFRHCRGSSFSVFAFLFLPHHHITTLAYANPLFCCHTGFPCPVVRPLQCHQSWRVIIAVLDLT
jgi:hypothetical protein